jgi:hypothetical protein
MIMSCLGANFERKEQAKGGHIRLDSKIALSVTMSPNGTVCISIECSTKPYELHPHQVWWTFSHHVAKYFAICSPIPSTDWQLFHLYGRDV